MDNFGNQSELVSGRSTFAWVKMTSLCHYSHSSCRFHRIALSDHHYLSNRFQQTLTLTGQSNPPYPGADWAAHPNRRQVSGAWAHLKSFLFFSFLLYFTELFPRLENKT